MHHICIVVTGLDTVLCQHQVSERLSSLRRDFSRDREFPSPRALSLGRFSSLWRVASSVPCEPGRVTTSKLCTSSFVVVRACGTFSQLGVATGIRDPLGSPSSAIAGCCELFTVISGSLMTPPMSLCETASFRRCRVDGFDILVCLGFLV
jgi:hypothetical protein